MLLFIGRIKRKWSSLSPVQQFLRNVAVAFIIWKSLYTFLLEPIRVPDKQLTKLIACGTAKFIEMLHPLAGKIICIDYPGFKAFFLYRNNKNILTIADRCNGLELMVMYAALILLLPYAIKRKMKFLIVGVLGLIVVNILRCVGLQWIYQFYQPLFETTHHYLFTLIMYVVIFFGWVLYVRKPSAYAKG